MYYLMNKNVPLLSFHMEKGIVSTIAVCDKMLNDIRIPSFDLNTWLASRNYAKHKEHLTNWTKEWGIDTIEGFIEVTHALSLNDTLWVKKAESELSWDCINLYDNEFSDIVEKTAFEGGLHGLQLSATTSPEFTAEGSFPKFWKRESDGIFLYKTGQSGAANVGLEPYSEYISSFIARQFTKQDVVRYDLVNKHGHICTKCKMFTSKDLAYVPMHRYTDRNILYSWENLPQLCAEYGVLEKFQEMIVLDSIVFNQDRHLGNFGFLVDSDSYEIVDFAPLFDFNISMLTYAMQDDLEDFSKYTSDGHFGHKLGGDFAKIGQAFLTDSIRSRIPRTIYLPIHSVYNLPEERMEFIRQITERNLQELMQDKTYTVDFKSDSSVEKSTVFA